MYELQSRIQGVRNGGSNYSSSKFVVRAQPRYCICPSFSVAPRKKCRGIRAHTLRGYIAMGKKKDAAPPPPPPPFAWPEMYRPPKIVYPVATPRTANMMTARTFENKRKTIPWQFRPPMRHEQPFRAEVSDTDEVMYSAQAKPHLKSLPYISCSHLGGENPFVCDGAAGNN